MLNKRQQTTEHKSTYGVLGVKDDQQVAELLWMLK